MQLDIIFLSKKVIFKKICIDTNPVKQYRKLFTKLINKKNLMEHSKSLTKHI